MTLLDQNHESPHDFVDNEENEGGDYPFDLANSATSQNESPLKYGR